MHCLESSRTVKKLYGMYCIMLVSIGQPSKLAPISLVGSAPTLRFGRLKYESWFGDFLSLLNHVDGSQ